MNKSSINTFFDFSTDVDECALLGNVCGEAQCVNRDGKFQCECPSGQEYNGMIAKCEPIPTGDFRLTNKLKIDQCTAGFITLPLTPSHENNSGFLSTHERTTRLHNYIQTLLYKCRIYFHINNCVFSGILLNNLISEAFVKPK